MNRTPHNCNPSKQAGLSLVEIMVALVISLFLMGGVVSVYSGNKSTYQFADASARVQENGRFALEMLTRDIRLAGFYGCVDVVSNPDLVQNHLDPDSDKYNDKRHDYINLEPLELTDNDGLNGSDSLLLRGSQTGSGTLTEDLAKPGSGSIKMTNDVNISTEDIVLITNCWTSDIFAATSVSSDDDETTINHSTSPLPNAPSNASLNTCAAGSHCLNGGEIDLNLDQAYTTSNTSVYVLQSVEYSIQPSANDAAEPALWRQRNHDNQELVEGVERMEFLYGIDSNGDGSPDQYVDSSANLGAGDVITSLRVWLLVRSDNDGVLEAAQTYTFNGQTIEAGDRRLRQVFSATVDLRNR